MGEDESSLNDLTNSGKINKMARKVPTKAEKETKRKESKHSPITLYYISVL